MTRVKEAIKKMRSHPRLGDEEFDKIYSPKFLSLSYRHFTQIRSVRLAIQLIGDSPDISILDIGSGIGKFCHIGSQLSKCKFTGVELRDDFYAEAGRIAAQLDQNKPTFIHGSFTSINFKKYNAFYFFNSFEEYYNPDCIIDEKTVKSQELYNELKTTLKEKLNEASLGSKLITYYVKPGHVPDTYTLKFSGEDGHMKLWVKER